MSVLAAFMVPHPPMIVPQIGRGSEAQILKTTENYIKVSKEIEKLSPETIVISSPHATVYRDYFHISPGKEAVGSFARFGAKEVSFREEYDEELVAAISEIAESENFPAGTKGEQEPKLDHGTMVPLYFIRKNYKRSMIVRIGLSGLSYEEHYRLGQIIARATEKINRKIVYVASGDLSHKLQEYGPYGFVKEGPEYDDRLLKVCAEGDLSKLTGFDENFCDRAAECGHRSFVIMAGVLDGLRTDAKVYSHEDVTGVGYGICSFYPKKEDEYVALARSSVETYIRTGEVFKLPDHLPKEMTEQKAGAFVSIHEKGRLRGCIGTILPTTDCIGEEIIQNAVSASTKDPRFPAITKEELPFLEISVDVLTKPEPISSVKELDVKRYGVIVTKGFRRGLLLPDLEGVDTVEDQVRIAAMKAGIGENEEVNLERFEVIRHH